MQEALRKASKHDRKDRSNHYHALVHRLVAVYVVKPPSRHHSIVGHLDFDKMNNAASNLRWMEPEENYAHQQLSLHVIREKKERVTTYRRYTSQRQAFAGEKIQGYQDANTGDQTGG